MNDRARTNLFGLGVMIATIGIATVVILRIWRPDLFSNPSGFVPDSLKSPACEVPCWEQITPGETNLDEAKLLLRGNSNVASVEEGDVSPYGLMLFVDIQGDRYHPNVSIGFDKNNITQSIKLAAFGENLYLNDVVPFYGFPEYVVVYAQETVGGDIDLVYPQRGLVINLYLQGARIMDEDDIRFTVSPTQEVTGISFYTPNLEYYYSFAWQPLKRYKWKGFTEYP